ncbi:MAG: PD-(D/E)XK nuclease family protein [Chloroflexota bacterium]|nr:PD-(D/E)XK nuclease family protein [Chloroflexota bacterium]
MPQQGFHCIVDFVDVPYEACIACAATNGRCQFTASLLRGMAEQAEGREPDEPGSASVTSLTGCARQTFLKETEPFYQRPDEQYWAYRGTIGHTMVERGAGEDVIVERRFARELRLPSGRTLTITGRPDEVVPERKLLVEYKTTDRPPKAPSLQHIAQLNAYRWVVAPEHAIERLGIVYLTMRGVQKASVPIWPDEQVERFLGERAAGLAQARETGEWPAMTEDTWMCNYCPVARACRRGPLTRPSTADAADLDVLAVGAPAVDVAGTDVPLAGAASEMVEGVIGSIRPHRVRMDLPVVSADIPDDPGDTSEPVVEPEDIDEWDPAERGALVAGAPA